MQDKYTESKPNYGIIFVLNHSLADVYEQRRNSHSDHQQKLRKEDHLAMYRNGSAEIPYNSRANNKNLLRHSPEIKDKSFEQDNQSAHDSLPTPEKQPQLNNDGISPKCPYFDKIHADEVENSGSDNSPGHVEQKSGIIVHQSKPSNSAGRSSNAPTEDDEEKINHIDQEQVSSLITQ